MAKYEGKELNLELQDLWCESCGNFIKRYFEKTKPIPTNIPCPNCNNTIKHFLVGSPKLRARWIEEKEGIRVLKEEIKLKEKEELEVRKQAKKEAEKQTKAEEKAKAEKEKFLAERKKKLQNLLDNKEETPKEETEETEKKEES